MTDNVYKKIELVGTSNTSIEGAVNNAITKAAKTMRQMRWLEVVEIRGTVEEDHVSQWQVVVKLGITVED